MTENRLLSSTIFGGDIVYLRSSRVFSHALASVILISPFARSFMGTECSLTYFEQMVPVFFFVGAGPNVLVFSFLTHAASLEARYPVLLTG